MTDNLESNRHCRDVIQAFDHDRYLTVLYAKQEKRDALFALYAFNYEISRIRESVSEPMLGEIRLQWWRESVEDMYQGTLRNHEVIPALAKAITQNELPKKRLIDMIDGRAQDLYDESPADMTALEDYLVKTVGNLISLAVHILGQRDIDDLARRLGLAWGLIGLIRAVPYHLSLKKNFMPMDLMAKGARLLSPDYPEATKTVIRKLCQQAEQHLDHIRNNKKHIAPDSRSAFLLAALARSYVKTIKKADYNPFRLEEKADAFFRQGRLLMAALFNRI